MAAPRFSTVDPLILRAYQDIRYGRPARRAVVHAVLWAVVGLALPFSLDYVSPANYRVYLALNTAMRYLPDICYGLAGCFVLRSLVGFILARSWCVTRWLGRRFG